MQCEKCLEQMNRTKWKPPAGIDPYLVGYKCPECGAVGYASTGKIKEAQSVRKKGFNR